MRRWVIGICALVAACGGGTRSPDTAQSVATQNARPPGEHALELANGEFPEGVTVWARVRSPAKDFPAIARLGIADDNAKTAFENPAFVVATFVGQRIARAVDFEAPMDVLLADGGMSNASIALRPIQGSVPAELDRKELESGRFLLEPKGNSAAQFQRCELWRTPSSGERIVCAADEERVVASARFLLARSESAPLRSSFRLEFSGKLLREGMQKRMAEKRREAGRESSAENLGGRFVESIVAGIRSLITELDIGKSGVEGSLEFTFKGSGVASNLASWFGPERARAVPDAFFKVPEDSELALIFAGVEHRTGEAPMRAFLREFLDAVWADVEITEQERQDYESATFAVLPNDGRSVLAFGHDIERARELGERVEAAESRGKKPNALELARLDEALAGWALIGVEADPARFLEELRRALELYQKPAPPKKKPGTQGASGGADDPKLTRSKVKIAPKTPADLPKGSLHAVDEIRPNPDYRPPPDGSKPVPIPHDVHIVAVPDGSVVWISIARDEKVAVARARAQLATKRGGSGLNAELRRRFGNRTVMSASLTFGGLNTLELDGETPASRSDSSVVLARLLALPNRGRTPIPAWVDVTRVGAGDAWSVKVQSNVSLPALLDIVKWYRSSDAVVGERQ